MNTHALETKHYKGHTISLYPDDNALNPREDDNLGHMVCWGGPRYKLGDDHPFDSREQFEECLHIIEQSRGDIHLNTINDPETFLEDFQTAPHPKTDLEQFLDQLDPDGATKVVLVPLYLYEHSEITMRTTPFFYHWDSGRVGYIYVERTEILKEYGGQRLTPALIERTTTLLRAEVENYDRYLRGAFVSYQITRRTGHDLDSCWGFEDPAHALAEAKTVIDHLVSQTRRHRAPARPPLTASPAGSR